MGVVNVTPDSFSDGGDFYDFSSAIDQSVKLIEYGADIIDIGGESSRPGATPIEPHIEQQRIIPIIKKLSEKGIIISVDTDVFADCPVAGRSMFYGTEHALPFYVWRWKIL